MGDDHDINDSVSNDTVRNNLMASSDNSSQIKQVSLQSDIKNEILEERSLAEIRSHDEEIADSKRIKILDIKTSSKIEDLNILKIPCKKKRGRPRKKARRKRNKSKK